MIMNITRKFYNLKETTWWKKYLIGLNNVEFRQVIQKILLSGKGKRKDNRYWVLEKVIMIRESAKEGKSTLGYPSKFEPKN